MQNKVITAQPALRPITIPEMCRKASDLFCTSARFAAMEQHLNKVHV